MKLTVLLLFITGMQVTAKSSAQTVSLSMENVKIQKVFREISRQTGFSVIYKESIFKNLSPVSIHLVGATIEEAFKECLKGQPLAFDMENNAVVIKPAPNRVMKISTELPDPPISVKGRVVNEQGEPLSGVTVTIKGSNIAVSTDANGAFELEGVDDNATLVFTATNIETFERKLKGRTELAITAKTKIVELEGLMIISTGYQKMPKERATGSFAIVDKEKMDQRMTTGVIDLLEGLATGLVFNRNSFTDQPTLEIRGRNTITSDAQPLIVVNGFPIEGDMNTINPDNIESITVLKDAAAASIWGVRAANGVIVITTRTGKFNQEPVVEFRSNLVSGDKPDYSYLGLMSTPNYIEAQRILFNTGSYASLFRPTSSKRIPAAVQIFENQKNGLITEDQANNQLKSLGEIDILNDFQKYLIQRSLKQQYSLNVSGGSKNSNYYFEGGYDNNVNNFKQNNYHRYNFSAENITKISDRLDFSVGTSIARIKETNPFNPNSNIYNTVIGANSRGGYRSSITPPYSRLADENGNPLAIPWAYNDAYKDTAYAKGLLNYDYVPLSDYNLQNRENSTQALTLRFGVNYKIIKGLSLDLEYNLERSTFQSRNLQDKNTYDTRSTINNFTEVLSNGNLVHHVPYGDILTNTKSELTAQTYRSLLNFNRSFAEGKHDFAAIAGIEQREVITEGDAQIFYGYNDRTLSYTKVDQSKPIKTYSGYTSNIYVPVGLTYIKHRYLSYFANGAYTFSGKYTFSASGRIDGSDQFGVKTNQLLNPLYSAGISWNILKESFLEADWLRMLKLRTTFGYSGNINQSVTAFTTAAIQNVVNNSTYFIPYASITNPENPNLRPERTKTINFGLDFALSNNRISGSIDYYTKKSTDLFGTDLLVPSSGFSTISSNVASMKGNGYELSLHSRNVSNKEFQWNTTFMLSHNTSKVTEFVSTSRTTNPSYMLQYGDRPTSFILPIPGYPLYGIWAIEYGGVDANGDAMAIGSNGKTYTDYREYFKDIDATPKLKYMGPGTPTFSGSFSNSFYYKNLSLTVDMLYKFGSYYRKSQLGYYDIDGGYSRGYKTFENRWQKPGDELQTTVPVFTGISRRNEANDFIYSYSDINVGKGDFIRLQNVILTYNIPEDILEKVNVKRGKLYFQASHLGLLWRANKDNIDPDFPPTAYSSYMPLPKTYAVGLKFSF